MLMIQVLQTSSLESKKRLFIRMMVAVIATMNIMMLSVAKYTGFFTGIS
jgi:Cu+-exporting ATPase